MVVVGIIPARYASTRLPGKPLVDICGKPMIQHVYEQAKQSRLLTDVFVATDDDRIERTVQHFGGKAVMTPQDIASGSDRIAFVARNLQADVVVNIQGDEPLIAPQLIDQTIQVLLDNPHAVVGTAVKKITTPQDIVNPNIVKAVIDKNNYALYFSRSPIPHVRDIEDVHQWLHHAAFYQHYGIYVYRKDFLQCFTEHSPTMLELTEKLEQLRIMEHGYKIVCAITEYNSIPVDTPEDVIKITNFLQTASTT